MDFFENVDFIGSDTSANSVGKFRKGFKKEKLKFLSLTSVISSCFVGFIRSFANGFWKNLTNIQKHFINDFEVSSTN